MAMDIPDQLRAACESVRRKDYPLATLIPAIQLAADMIDQLRTQLQEQAQTLASYRAEVGALREEVGRVGAAGIGRGVHLVIDGVLQPWIEAPELDQ